ncbi:MAG: DUF302 domain-containing protein [Gammaproteobacteria bacterium]|jgi:hypothetical protein|nr:DUF302 domain-containing protein [Gammaproteobacteria bacterium]MBT7307207.1 DUF302 domain-containing protein [Gammaproteobacteria bacterium]
MRKIGSFLLLIVTMMGGTQSAVSGGFGDLVLGFDVVEGMSGEDIDEAIRSQSIEQGINHVFFAPLYKQVEALTGKPYRHMTIHHLCDARVGAEIADLDETMVVMMPCRIAVVENKDKLGTFRLYTTNPAVVLTDPNISKGVKDLILDFAPKLQALTENVAAGEF